MKNRLHEDVLITTQGQFPQTATVLQQGDIAPCPKTDCISNKALYLLIGSNKDGYFQRVIKECKGQRDKALVFVKTKCANVSALDKNYFHNMLTTMHIKENESVTSFLWQYMYAKAEAEGASNNCSETQLVSFALAGMHTSKKSKYDTALQLYHLEQENGKTFTLEDIEKIFCPK